MNAHETFATLTAAIVLRRRKVLPPVKDVVGLLGDSCIEEGILELIPHAYDLSPLWTGDLIESLLLSSHWVHGMGFGLKTFGVFSSRQPEDACRLAARLMESKGVNERSSAMMSISGLCFIKKSLCRKLMLAGMQDSDESVRRIAMRNLPCIAEADPKLFDLVYSMARSREGFTRLLEEYVMPYGPSTHWESRRAEGDSNKLEIFWDTLTLENGPVSHLFKIHRWCVIPVMLKVNEEMGFRRLRNLVSMTESGESLVYASLCLPWWFRRIAGDFNSMKNTFSRFLLRDTVASQLLICMAVNDGRKTAQVISDYGERLHELRLCSLLADCINFAVNM